MEGKHYERLVLATSILSPTFVVDAVFGYTPYHSGSSRGPIQCWGAEFANRTRASPALARSRPRRSSTWAAGLATPSKMRGEPDNQIKWSAIRATKGTQHVKFGFDVERNPESLRNAGAGLHLTAGRPRSAV